LLERLVLFFDLSDRRRNPTNAASTKSKTQYFDESWLKLCLRRASQVEKPATTIKPGRMIAELSKIKRKIS